MTINDTHISHETRLSFSHCGLPKTHVTTLEVGGKVSHISCTVCQAEALRRLDPVVSFSKTREIELDFDLIVWEVTS
jgi:hypothetical protein